MDNSTSDRLAALERDLRRDWRKPLLALGGLLLIAWAVLQLIPLDMDNPPVVGEPDWSVVSPDVRALAVDACFDCHSHETDWPWYSKVAPMRVYIWNEVREGRRDLNFSDWAAAPGKIEDIERQIEKDLMPPWAYTLGHPEARLSASDKQALIDGLRQVIAATDAGSAP